MRTTAKNTSEKNQDNQSLSKSSIPSKTGVNKILIVVLIIFAFFMGMLVTKMSYLELQVKGSQVPSTQTAQQGNTAAAPAVSTAPAAPVNVAVGNYPPKGDANAKVTVIEFADLRCPFCEQWFQNVEPSLISDYVNTGKVKFYFRNYAFLGPASTLAAEAGECANDQGQWWAFHDYMYKNQPDESDTSMYTNDNLAQIAGNLGMDTSQFSSCLSDPATAQKVAKDLSDGQAAGVNGTPTTFINGTPIVGAVPYAQIKAEIDKALQQ